MKLNLAIFALFLGLSSGIYAMEEQPSQNFSLKLSDGETISLPEEVVLYSSLIRTYLKDNEIYEKSPTIDFSELQLFVSDIDDSDDNEKIHDLALNSKIVGAVFDYVIHGKKILHDL